MRKPGSSSSRGVRSGRRLAATVSAGLLLAGCVASYAPSTGDPRLDLEHADPRVRIQAALQSVEAHRLDLLEMLVANLGDRDGAVRLFSVVALRKLSGRDFGYKPHGTDDERRAAIARWRTWVAGRPPTGDRPGEGDGGVGPEGSP